MNHTKIIKKHLADTERMYPELKQQTLEQTAEQMSPEIEPRYFILNRVLYSAIISLGIGYLIYRGIQFVLGI